MRILFITANRIGDAVLTTGVLSHLVRSYPDARFTIACGPLTADLFRATPCLERLIVFRKKKWNGHWLDLWKQCVGTRWDLIVDLRNSVVSRLLISKKRAYRPAHASGRHKVIDNAASLSLDPPPSPRIFLDAKAEDAAARLVSSGGPLLALGPAANWPAKQWPVEKFTELARRLTAADGPLPHARVLVVAAPHEREMLRPLLQALPPEQIIDAIGHDLLAVAACLKRCRLYIGNDSGLMHIAAAMGVPTLGLFGPGYEKIYGPWGKNCAVARTPESAEELLARMPSSGASGPNLMRTLHVDRAFAAAQALILNSSSTH